MQSCNKKTAGVSSNMQIADSSKCHEHFANLMQGDKRVEVLRKKIRYPYVADEAECN
jgi:hypothetical protein